MISINLQPTTYFNQCMIIFCYRNFENESTSPNYLYQQRSWDGNITKWNSRKTDSRFLISGPFNENFPDDRTACAGDERMQQYGRIIDHFTVCRIKAAVEQSDPQPVIRSKRETSKRDKQREPVSSRVSTNMSVPGLSFKKNYLKLMRHNPVLCRVISRSVSLCRKLNCEGLTSTG